jgi:hypothetical protein
MSGRPSTTETSGSALPAWDSFSRSAHNVSNIPSMQPPSAQQQPPLNFPFGSTWTKLQFDSNQGGACIDPSTRMILSWYHAHRPDHSPGPTLNHAVEFNNLHMDRDLFISTFYCTRYNPATQYKQFSSGFPSLESNGDLKVVILPFLTSLAPYCAVLLVSSYLHHIRSYLIDLLVFGLNCYRSM